MSRRAAAVEETRRRIVGAALDLHTRQGIAVTRWEDIAARAGVGVGTVYRHFPSLDELVPACGATSMELLALPPAADAAALFAGAKGVEARAGRLAREVFAIYERGAHILRVMRREPHVHPEVARGVEEVDAVLGALVDAALAPLDVDADARRVTRALLDLGTWTAFREQGMDTEEAVAAVTALLACRLGHP